MSDIFSQAFAVYEKLAAAKMESFRTAINTHNHSSSGSQIYFNTILGTIAGVQIGAGVVTGANISDDTITIGKLDLTTIHLSSDGYAVYA